MVQNRDIEVAQCFEKAVVLGIRDFWVHYYLGEVYAEMGHYDLSMEHYGLAAPFPGSAQKQYGLDRLGNTQAEYR
jgi:hypothetical protein